MELVKPEPLIISGRAHYTLTSYDPVSIVIDVASTTDEDVELAVQMSVMQLGGGPAELADEAWIRENFEGLHNASELRELVRQELMAMNGQAAEQQKVQKCAKELAKRLVQAVPQSSVARARQMVEQSFAMGLQEQGVTENEFMIQTGMRTSDLQAMFATQAKDVAEQEAAIDAWIEHRNLQISDEEIPQYAGMPPTEDTTKLLYDLHRSGQYESARTFALRNKGMSIVMAEASCTYRHETPAQAQKRAAQTRRTLEAQMQAQAQRRKANSRSHLKLV